MSNVHKTHTTIYFRGWWRLKVPDSLHQSYDSRCFSGDLSQGTLPWSLCWSVHIPGRARHAVLSSPQWFTSLIRQVWTTKHKTGTRITYKSHTDTIGLETFIHTRMPSIKRTSRGAGMAFRASNPSLPQVSLDLPKPF